MKSCDAHHVWEETVREKNPRSTREASESTSRLPLPVVPFPFVVYTLRKSLLGNVNGKCKVFMSETLINVMGLFTYG
jgi:hypothetical protein